jgi:hypothetical protein
LRKKVKTLEERNVVLEKEQVVSSQEIEKLMDILYGVDRAKEFD